MNRGFTLLELLLVIVLSGIILAVVIPRAQRAAHDTKFNQVRQCGAEIAAYMNLWARKQSESQRVGSRYTIKDFFMENIDKGEAGFRSYALVDKYTGDDNFNGVEMLIPPEKIQKNPFNKASYFNEANDDPGRVPSLKTGLLYFVSTIDPAIGNRNFRNFYLIFTGSAGKIYGREGNWYGLMDDKDEDAVRMGIFVDRMPDTDKRGG